MKRCNNFTAGYIAGLRILAPGTVSLQSRAAEARSSNVILTGERTGDQLIEADPSLGHAAKVGSYTANAWGLHDLHGNIFESCRDWHQPQNFPPARIPIYTLPKLHPESDGEAAGVMKAGRAGLPFAFDSNQNAATITSASALSS